MRPIVLNIRDRQQIRSRSMHVKQTQARYSALFKQTLAHILFVQFLDLRPRHVVPVRREVAVGLGANANQFIVRGRRHQDREQLFLQNCQPPFEVFEPRQLWALLDRLRHVSQ